MDEQDVVLLNRKGTLKFFLVLDNEDKCLLTDLQLSILGKLFLFASLT